MWNLLHFCLEGNTIFTSFHASLSEMVKEERQPMLLYRPLHPNGSRLQEIDPSRSLLEPHCSQDLHARQGKEQLVPPGCPALPPLARAMPGCRSANSRAHKIIIAWHLSPTVLNIPSQVKSQFTLLWGTRISVHSWYSGEKKTRVEKTTSFSFFTGSRTPVLGSCHPLIPSEQFLALPLFLHCFLCVLCTKLAVMEVLTVITQRVNFFFQ